jgi:hypothetical protein
MQAVRSQSCRVEYLSNQIIIHGPSIECQREARRILRRFAGSATPYRLDSVLEDCITLKPVGS